MWSPEQQCHEQQPHINDINISTSIRIAEEISTGTPTTVDHEVAFVVTTAWPGHSVGGLGLGGGLEQATAPLRLVAGVSLLLDFACAGRLGLNGLQACN